MSRIKSLQQGSIGQAEAVVNLIPGQLEKIENGIAYINVNSTMLLNYNGTSFNLPDDIRGQFFAGVLVPGNNGGLTSIKDALSSTPNINDYDDILVNGLFVMLQPNAVTNEKIAVQ